MISKPKLISFALAAATLTYVNHSPPETAKNAKINGAILPGSRETVIGEYRRDGLKSVYCDHYDHPSDPARKCATDLKDFGDPRSLTIRPAKSSIIHNPLLEPA